MAKTNNTNFCREGSPQGELVTRLLSELQELREVVFEIRDRVAGATKSHYTVEEVAAIVARAPFTIRRWVKAGQLHAERVAGTGPRGRLLVPHSEIQKLIGVGKGARVSNMLGQVRKE